MRALELERPTLSTSTPDAEIAAMQTARRPSVSISKRIDMRLGLGRDSVLTEETGFPLWMEMDRFYDDLNFALSSGKSLPEALRITTNELVVNIRDYEVEFIKSSTVIPHANGFAVVDGVQRMVGNNGRPVVDAVSPQERNGSVLEAARIVDSFLPSTEPNSYTVTMSPSGWSGYELRHKNAQVMVCWKDRGGVSKGLTMVTDLSEEQSRQVMIGLGVAEEVLIGETEQERLANIVKNPALLAFPRSDITPFEYVFDKILAIRGSGDIKLLQKDNSEEIRSVEQTRADIRRFDELLVFDQKEEEYIAELQEFIMRRIFTIGDSSIQEEIAKKIEDTVLKLAREYLKKNKTNWKDAFLNHRESMQQDYEAKVIRDYPTQDDDNFSPEVAFLKSRGGCPTGGLSAARGVSSVSSGSGSSIEKGSGVCTECGNSNMDNHYHCPDCKKKYADETNTTRTAICRCGFEFGCGGSANNEEKQEKDSNVIVFSATASNQSSVSTELVKAA